MSNPDHPSDSGARTRRTVITGAAVTGLTGAGVFRSAYAVADGHTLDGVPVGR